MGDEAYQPFPDSSASVPDRVVDAADLARGASVLGATAEAGPSPAALPSSRLTSGFTDEELDALAARVIAEVGQAARRHLEAMAWPEGVRWDIGLVPTTVGPGDDLPASYRWPEECLGITITVGPGRPVAASTGASVAVATSDAVDPLVVLPWNGGQGGLSLSRRECTGGLGKVAKVKIDTWARALLATLLADEPR